MISGPTPSPRAIVTRVKVRGGRDRVAVAPEAGGSVRLELAFVMARSDQ